MTRTILFPGWIIDGTGSQPLSGHAVVISGDKIEAVSPAGDIQIQPGDQQIDLAGATLLPGLINGHVHSVLPGDGTPFPNVQLQSDVALALQATHNVEEALQHGVTTVRDCGGRGTIITDVRDAQARGLIHASRIIACGRPLTIKGGHCRYFGGEADGEEGVQVMVRHLVSTGADFIKVMASGGGTPGTLPNLPAYTTRELKAIVQTAHGFGRKVSAHCSNTATIANAVEAGVDIIDHCTFCGPDGVYQFDAEVARRLADAGVAVTPTLQVFRDMVDILPDGPERARWQRMCDTQRDITHRLNELGVTLLAGSDAGWRMTAFGSFWKELDEMVIAGLSTAAAIHAASGAITHTLGLDGQYGTIRPGLAADLLAVDGDVSTEGVRRLQQVRAVIQGGAWRVAPAPGAPARHQ